MCKVLVYEYELPPRSLKPLNSHKKMKEEMPSLSSVVATSLLLYIMSRSFYLNYVRHENTTENFSCDPFTSVLLREK